MGHLDPTDRGELHACDNTQPASCQAGDLAGKHGNVTTMSFTASYLELYLSSTPGSPYFFGDKSIVVHSANTTRLTCANFTLMSDATSTTGAPSSTSSTVAYTGAAVALVEGKVGVFVGILGALFSLL